MDQALCFQRAYGRPVFVLLFSCADDSISTRLASRGEKRIGNDHSILKTRLEIFSEKTLPLIHYFESKSMLVRVLAEPNKDIVFSAAQKYFRPLSCPGMDVICITGCHLSGKSTLAKKLSQSIGGIHICVSDLIRNEVDRGFHLGSELLKDMSIGNQIGSDVVLYLLQRSLERYQHVSGQPIILDGFPFTLEQLEVFQRTVGNVKLLIHLKTTADVICSRNLEEENLCRRKHLVYTSCIHELEQALSNDSRYRVIDASKSMEDVAAISTLLSHKLIISQTLSIGDQAPNFVADTTSGIINFYFWKGESWAIIFSYSESLNPVCQAELNAVAQRQTQWTDRSVKVLALSNDKLDTQSSVFSDEFQNKWATFPIIADCDRRVALSYGILEFQDQIEYDDKDAFFTTHSVFIIDPKNTVRATLKYPTSIPRDFDEIMKLLDVLQAPQESLIGTSRNTEILHDRIQC
jgi:alkyl hydroperoxide reductase subunit AhpC/adenylate kinase family enzyme